MVFRLNNRSKYKQAGPIELVVMQSTSFCNIDCSYCYLSNRNIKNRMSHETVSNVVKRILESKLLGERVTFVWHAGEPTTIEPQYYSSSFDLINDALYGLVKVDHSFQTNATLINDSWVKLIQEYGVKLGVSLDGPEFVHDQYRKSRNGKGTHSQVMRGVEKLRQSGIHFHTISVLTRESLKYPDEIFQHLIDVGSTALCFNIEEIECDHSDTSLNYQDIRRDYIAFFHRIAVLRDKRIQIREIDDARNAIMSFSPTLFRKKIRNQQAHPFSILNIDASGNVSSFSPELVGQTLAPFGQFAFGNVRDNSLKDIFDNEKFQNVLKSISSGIKKCEKECKYFSVCGGGAPANKYFENGSFEAAETLFCELSRKSLIDYWMGAEGYE